MHAVQTLQNRFAMSAEQKSISVTLESRCSGLVDLDLMMQATLVKHTHLKP